jgi:predicted nucleic acid-binding Zn ribbon protein
MKRSSDRPIGDAIREFLNTYNLEDKLNETRLIHSWEKVVGPMIAKYTRKMYIRNKILYVKVESAALRTELSFSRSRILRALNEEVKATVIEDIVLN